MLKTRVLQAFPLRLSALLSSVATLNNTAHSRWGFMLGRGWWAGNLGLAIFLTQMNFFKASINMQMRLNPVGKTYLRIFDFCCFCLIWWSLYELTGELAHDEFKTYQNFFFFFFKVWCLVMWEFQRCELVKYYRKLCFHILRELTWQRQWPWTACCLLTPPSPQRFFQHRFPGCNMHSPCCSLWKIQVNFRIFDFVTSL